MEKVRVRTLLDSIKGTGRRGLKKYLPEYTLPEDVKGVFPNALYQSLEKGSQCSILGLVTEALVLNFKVSVNCEEIVRLAFTEPLDAKILDKIKKSKTTTDYISKIVETRTLLRKSLIDYNGKRLPLIELEKSLGEGKVVGHPDGLCGKSIIEVKTSSRLEKDIEYFLLQLFSYAALGGDLYSHAVLVLPLQKRVMSFNLKAWKHGKALLAALTSKVDSLVTYNPVNLMRGSILVQNFGIGSHIHKSTNLVSTLNSIWDSRPVQLFLGGNRTTHIKLDEKDLLQASEIIHTRGLKVYVHTAYVVNTSAKVEGDWNLEYVKNVLGYSSAFGASGVVIHTGKYTSSDYSTGVKNMRDFIEKALPYASEETPILLETPSGQGTETLISEEEFSSFILSFESKKIAACVDTCHVFANGHDPLEYVIKVHKKGILRLVHFNDSMGEKGCCVDSHAPIGGGKIDLEIMALIADYCSKNGVCMVVE